MQVDSGTLPELRVDVDESMEVIVPINKELMGIVAEYHINFHFITKSATPWCGQGHEVGWEQFVLSIPDKEIALIAECNNKIICAKDGNNTIVSSGKLQLVVIDGGAETEIKYDGVKIISKGPELQMWRACTDNDGIRAWSGQEHKPMMKWRSAGLDKLQVESSASRIIENKNSVTVEIEKVRVGSDPSLKIKHIQCLTVTSAGTIEVDNKIIADDELPSLPRIGVVLNIAEGFNDLEWFGRGPHENYIDRNAGAPVGHYKSSVDEQYVPYILPQEHGNKTDVRWLELENGDLTVRFTADSKFEFSARRFSSEDLFSVTHTCDLIPRKDTILSIDAIQRGVGTGSCGPQTLEKYSIAPGEYNFKYIISID